METFQINDYINSLNIIMPDMNNFLRLSRIFKVYSEHSKYFAELNYDRGALLYGLIAKKRPKHVLEIGTAGGFSTMCMAWSMYNNNIDGSITTVDPTPHDKLLPRLVDFDGESNSESIMMSTREYWKKYANVEWLKKISVKSCYSDELLEMNMPKIDFCYIDGHHIYEAVASDFSLFMLNAADKFTVVFDDYVEDIPDHVKKAIDIHVKPWLDYDLLRTNYKDQNRTFGVNTQDSFMCITDSERREENKYFDSNVLIRNIKRYRNIRHRYERRKIINKLIPFLKNIRFRNYL